MHVRVRFAFSVTAVLCLVVGGAQAQIAAPPRSAPPIAPTPKQEPRIGKAPCPQEPIKVTRIVVDPQPAVRCKPSNVTITITAQACGAPSGGSYRVRVGEKIFAWGDVPALSAGSSTEAKTTYVPGPMEAAPTIIAEVGPPVLRPSTGAAPSMGGFGAGFGLGSSMFKGALAGGLGLPLPTVIDPVLGDVGRGMKNGGADLMKQAETVNATKTPTWVEDAKIAFAKKLEALGTRSVSLGDRMLTICPHDAGVEAKSWIDQMKTELTDASAAAQSAAELKAALQNAKVTFDSMGAGTSGAAIGLLVGTPLPGRFGGFGR